MSTPSNTGRPDVDELAEQLNDPEPAAAPAEEPGRETGATASERASAQTAAELSGR